MYTPRALFSRLCLKIYRFILSFYIVGQLVTLPCEVSVQSPIILLECPADGPAGNHRMVCVHT